jgi:hypothetical protein
MTDFGDLLADIRGVRQVRHAWLTRSGTYSTTDAVPGVNHIAHAVGHVNALCAATTARAAA